MRKTVCVDLFFGPWTNEQGNEGKWMKKSRNEGKNEDFFVTLNNALNDTLKDRYL